MIRERQDISPDVSPLCENDSWIWIGRVDSFDLEETDWRNISLAFQSRALVVVLIKLASCCPCSWKMSIIATQR